MAEAQLPNHDFTFILATLKFLLSLDFFGALGVAEKFKVYRLDPIEFFDCFHDKAELDEWSDDWQYCGVEKVHEAADITEQL